MGVTFSKNGIKSFIENMFANENCNNVTDPENAKKWEMKLETPNIKFFLKRGGSEFSSG